MANTSAAQVLPGINFGVHYENLIRETLEKVIFNSDNADLLERIENCKQALDVIHSMSQGNQPAAETIFNDNNYLVPLKELVEESEIWGVSPEKSSEFFLLISRVGSVFIQNIERLKPEDMKHRLTSNKKQILIFLLLTPDKIQIFP